MPTYNRDYFVKKFESIPTNNFYDGGLYENPEQPSQKCALGHCGVQIPPCIHQIGWYAYPEAKALDDLFKANGLIVPDVNDGNSKQFQQPFAKDRILAALKSFPDETTN